MGHPTLLSMQYIWRLHSAAEVWEITWKPIQADLNLNMWQIHVGIPLHEGTAHPMYQIKFNFAELTEPWILAQNTLLSKSDNFFVHLIFTTRDEISEGDVLYLSQP